MARIFIQCNKTKYKVKCTSLIPLIQESFATETDKTEWPYEEFCRLVGLLPKIKIIKYLNQNTDDNISPSDSIGFEKEDVIALRQS